MFIDFGQVVQRMSFKDNSILSFGCHFVLWSQTRQFGPVVTKEMSVKDISIFIPGSHFV